MLIAKKTAEDHGGTITVESEQGKGTKVSFVIPTAVADKAPPVEATSELAD